MAHYRGCLDGLPCLVDEHNVEYKILERCSDTEKILIKRKLYALQAEKMKRFEARKIREFSACSAVSGPDAQLLEQLLAQLREGSTCVGPDVPIHVLPNGVDTQYFQPVTGIEEEEALAFTGSLDWLPNDDAVLYFAREILPLIWQKKPAVKFYVVGKSPSVAVRDLAADERIAVTGRVEDVRPYLHRAKVFVVPLRIGGGTRLKILEAMSAERPVVSTTVGAEGIDYRDQHNIVLADQPAEFAQKVVDLLEDAAARRDLGRAGRQLVLNQYDWAIIGETLSGIYGKMLNEK
jgi:glycosyltransferase involved in cell wall biosynthesis